jgi:hypothetical protein
MVTDTLVTISEEMRGVGWFLAEKLGEAQFPFEAMFWSDFYEEDFRLYLASSLVDQQGLRITYDALSKVFEANHLDSEWGFPVYNVTLIGMSDPKLFSVRQRYGSVPLDRRWVRRVSLRAGEAYVYCLKPQGSSSS